MIDAELNNEPRKFCNYIKNYTVFYGVSFWALLQKFQKLNLDDNFFCDRVNQLIE